MNPDKGMIKGETQRSELWGNGAVRAKVKIVYELGKGKICQLENESAEHKLRRRLFLATLTGCKTSGQEQLGVKELYLGEIVA